MHRIVRCLIHGLALLGLSAQVAWPIDGAVTIHDPSTVVVCDGRYYVYGTGRGISCLTSKDGYTWERGPRVFDRIPESVHAFVPDNDGAGVWAPDVVKLNRGYGLYYAVSKWGTSESAAIGLVTSPTLDPQDARYKWTDQGMITHSLPKDDYSAIDPGVCRAPDGTLWMCSGSFHGKIQLVQLNPETGRRIAPDTPASIIGSGAEASDLIFHDGYFYLFLNRGSCCQGKNSTYNIRVGRSRKVTGPYLDRHGDDMTRGGGTLFAAAEGKLIGPGHFGLLADDGVEKFSCHYEADLDHGGRPTLAIRPLLWTPDGWPLAGNDDFATGTYQIRSQQIGTVLQAPKDGNRATAAATTARRRSLLAT